MKSSGYISKELFHNLDVKNFRKISKFMSLLFTDLDSELIWTLYDDSVYIYYRYSKLYIQRRYFDEYNELQISVVTERELLNSIRKNKLNKICSKI